MNKLIFISNDDGYDAAGVQQLAEMMRELGDVFVVAPEGARSGASMSISSHTPVKNKLIKDEPATEGRGSLTVQSPLTATQMMVSSTIENAKRNWLSYENVYSWRFKLRRGNNARWPTFFYALSSYRGRRYIW